MKTIKVTLQFPAGKSTRPVTSYLIRDYNLVFNILQARIDMGMEGTLTMELTGDETDLARGLARAGDRPLHHMGWGEMYLLRRLHGGMRLRRPGYGRAGRALL